ncbi:MAG: hypothetical protein M3Q23_14310 [Actinomycetota bacterium]|nr:hypothetical protein [Actinomycetota bacterium]
MRRLAIALALAAAIPALSIRPAWACSCAQSTPRQVASGADAVFTGTVASIPRVTGQTVSVDFEVDTVYKGPPGPRLTVTTNAQGSACGLVFRPNVRYTVFAFRDHGLVSANLCSPPVRGAIDPGRYGLTAKLVGVHEPVSRWLAALSLIPLAIVVLLVVRSRRRPRVGGPT